MPREEILIQPQPGFQTNALSTEADVAFIGGSAGAGKTWCLLAEPMRYIHNREFGAVIFRNSYPEIMMEGALWDESKELYAKFNATPNESKMRWTFPEGAQVSFKHLNHERELAQFQGSQIACIEFDEVTRFTKRMFTFMFTRNRSRSGVKPFIRCSCNPDPESWVADFLEWWIDQETGYPITERAGVVRYFTVDQSNFVWGDTREEVLMKVPHLFNPEEIKEYGIEALIKSCTFIPGSVYDNKILLAKDPGYLGNLKAQDEDVRARMLDGNWKIRSDKKAMFEFDKLNDMFTNVVPERREERTYITIDHARKGKDLCTIGVWKGWRMVRLDVLLTSDTNQILKVVANSRRLYAPIPASQIIVDQDGIGVADALGCKVFQGGNAAVPVTSQEKENPSNKNTTRTKKPIHRNFKAQCTDHAATMVNAALVFIDEKNFYIQDGANNQVRGTSVKQAGKFNEIKRRFREDLRPVKREKDEPFIEISSKEVQKNANGGLSPDFGDQLTLRAAFDFIKQPIGFTKR